MNETYRPQAWKPSRFVQPEGVKTSNQTTSTSSTSGIATKDTTPSSTTSSSSTSSSLLSLVNDMTSYLDVRGNRDLTNRRIPNLQTGVLSTANGSALFELDDSKVLCAVHGPMQSSRSEFSESGVLTCTFQFATFAQGNAKGGRKYRPRESPEELRISGELQEALAVSVQLGKFPKHEIVVEVMALERGGSNLLTGALTAASAALADSGIEMYDIVSSGTCCFVKGLGVVTDPSLAEMNHPDCLGVAIVGYLPALNQVSFLHQTGRLAVDQSLALVDKAVQTAKENAEDIRNALMEEVKRNLQVDAAVHMTSAGIDAIMMLNNNNTTNNQEKNTSSSSSNTSVTQKGMKKGTAT